MPRKALVPLVILVLLGSAVGAWAVLDEDDNLRRPHLTPPQLASVPCPAGLANCRSVRGRVIYVERVDADGDGDLHVILAGRGGVTAPGVSVVDVSRKLRPARDPRVGDSVAAAGPVERGSYGQSQVAAVAFRVLRR